MVHLELSPDEGAELLDIIRSVQSHLAVEIAHTDHREFKHLLHTREAKVAHIVELLERQVTTERAA